MERDMTDPEVVREYVEALSDSIDDMEEAYDLLREYDDGMAEQIEEVLDDLRELFREWSRTLYRMEHEYERNLAGEMNDW